MITVLPGPRTPTAAEGQREAALATCTDYHGSPFNPSPCAASFLQCFACRNAISSRDHLPAQLALLDELAAHWEGMDREVWWRRFGQAWLALTEDILPRFTPAELEAAARDKPSGTVLDPLEGPLEETWI
ncbi:hypothetical protein [Streptomyces curacoi]|uniref:Uncharacterized protein n=1 Tax=Streptomyces curacoi TaxID=146536 RepID=A0A117NTK7_9ACTN|nr:hypothetical protein [Streptomyces curacoi]KUM67176.1 hypothetical protein AQI70_36590 [Streptomyces curacoi]